MKQTMLHLNEFLQTLPICGLGLAGVFIVMAAIYLCVRLLCGVLSKKKAE